MIYPPSHRTTEILRVVGQAYPDAWKHADRMRALRGGDLPDWPDWCYLPLHGAYAIISGGGDNRVPFAHLHHIGIVAALASWRMGKQIIRYDETLCRSLIDTPPSGELPVSLFYRLPTWCLYIETPDTAPDAQRGLIPIPLILGQGSIADALQRVIESGMQQAALHGKQLPAEPQITRSVAATLTPIVSLVLYLCSESPDWDLEPPKNPPEVKTKRGLRTFAVPNARIWDVGVRIGAALRKAQALQASELDHPDLSDKGHASPRAHIRRAHWHTYLTGSGRARRILKWLPPIPVNIDDIEELPATVRHVKPLNE